MQRVVLWLERERNLAHQPHVARTFLAEKAVTVP